MREPDKCSMTADMDNLSERIATLEADNARLTRERDRLQATLGHAGLSDEACARIGNLVEDMVKRHSAAYALPTASPRVPPLPPGLGGTESEYLANIKAARTLAEQSLASCGIKPREVPPPAKITMAPTPPNMPDRALAMDRVAHKLAEAALREPTELPVRSPSAPSFNYARRPTPPDPRSPNGRALVAEIDVTLKIGVWVEPAHWGPHATEVLSMTLPSEDDVLKAVARDPAALKRAYAEASRG